MLRLKAQNKKFNDFTEIDKFALIPKKWWGSFELGINNVTINGTEVSVRIYEVPCTCSKNRHTHLILDLRQNWEKLKLKDHDRIEVNK